MKPFVCMLISLVLSSWFPVSRLFAGEARVTVIEEKGGRLDWCAVHNKIAFDKRGPDGYFDVYVMDPDGANQKCLTCDTAGMVPSKHNGNPAWHPSGKYIVFQSQKERVPQKFDKQSSPGAGVLNDLWIMTADGTHFYKLINLEARIKDAPALIHAHFSHNGEKLFWAERIGRGTVDRSTFGKWVLRVADFTLDAKGRPRLSGIQTYHPGEQWDFYESHDFSPDANTVLFSGNLQQGQPGWGIDIYELDLTTGKVANLTNTKYVWDEHAHYSPDGSKIAWMSSLGHSAQSLKQDGLKADYWIMNRDGSGKQQVTFFNQAGHAHHLGTERAAAADCAFSPDGRSLIGFVALNPLNENDPDGCVVLVDNIPH